MNQPRSSSLETAIGAPGVRNEAGGPSKQVLLFGGSSLEWTPWENLTSAVSVHPPQGRLQGEVKWNVPQAAVLLLVMFVENKLLLLVLFNSLPFFGVAVVICCEPPCACGAEGWHINATIATSCYNSLEKKTQPSFPLPLPLPDAKRIFQASLANAQILIPSSQASVSTMLLEGRTLLALATTMYAPGGVDQVRSEILTSPLLAVVGGLRRSWAGDVPPCWLCWTSQCRVSGGSSWAAWLLGEGPGMKQPSFRLSQAFDGLRWQPSLETALSPPRM